MGSWLLSSQAASSPISCGRYRHAAGGGDSVSCGGDSDSDGDSESDSDSDSDSARVQATQDRPGQTARLVQRFNSQLTHNPQLLLFFGFHYEKRFAESRMKIWAIGRIDRGSFCTHSHNRK